MSSRRTTAASTVSRPSLRRLRSCSTRRRSLGSALPNSSRPSIFRGVPLGAEVGVVAILLAAAGIDAGRLEMAVGIGAEPGVGIGRRQADRVQPVDLVAVGDALAVGVEIGPVAAHSLAGDAGLAVAAVPQHDALRFTRLIGRLKRPAEEARFQCQGYRRSQSPDHRDRRLRGIGAVRAARRSSMSAGAEVTLASPTLSPIQATVHDDPGQDDPAGPDHRRGERRGF